ncbi:hypothetical protein FP2506_11582 [Fulvimarina pelagi HTCC2506]|uniref:Uncharacterized protein n=1 Tax=Fulvimarina pelagi HTCC2506 TaxID=314231 RepID=Q0FYW3_9HYPH|nr:hypothetical protein [Fulvimarina pelagi]EAU40195.1 hypothetical protein FP2506_11582 [Fulvimarina pelagi HTCC2506]
MARRPRDLHTRDLFADIESVAVGYDEVIVGKGPLSSKIARIVSRATQDAREDFGITRAMLSVSLSERLGRPVSEDTIEKWASEAAEGNRIPLDAFVALIGETKSYEALGFIPSMFGFAVVEARYVDLIEEVQVENQIELLQSRRATLSAKRRARS